MDFVTLLRNFIGRTVEAVVPSSLFEGILTQVQATSIQIQEPGSIYGSGQLVTIPTSSLDYVRILV